MGDDLTAMPDRELIAMIKAEIGKALDALPSVLDEGAARTKKHALRALSAAMQLGER